MIYQASIIAALGAAVSFAVAAVLQQEAAQSVSDDESLRFRLLIDLLHRPKWLAGVGALLAGYGLQALALAYGPVALVQPIIVTELAFAIPLAIWRRDRRAGLREWAGIACVIGGVTTFLAVASPASGIPDPSDLDWLATLVPIGAVVAVAVALGSRATGPKRAMLLGAAAGMAFGLLAVLTKTTTFLLGQSIATAFTSWQLYLVIVAGIVALLVSQSAYQAGPLAYSMPLVGVLEPGVAVVVGATVFAEEVRLSPGQLVLEVIAAVVACAGIVLLTTSPIVLSVYEEGRGSTPPAVPPGISSASSG